MPVSRLKRIIQWNLILSTLNLIMYANIWFIYFNIQDINNMWDTYDKCNNWMPTCDLFMITYTFPLSKRNTIDVLQINLNTLDVNMITLYVHIFVLHDDKKMLNLESMIWNSGVE